MIYSFISQFISFYLPQMGASGGRGVTVTPTFLSAFIPIPSYQHPMMSLYENSYLVITDCVHILIMDSFSLTSLGGMDRGGLKICLKLYNLKIFHEFFWSGLETIIFSSHALVQGLQQESILTTGTYKILKYFSKGDMQQASHGRGGGANDAILMLEGWFLHSGLISR